MILAFSTSSPLASIAFIDASGEIVFSREKVSPRAASGACLEMLSESGLSLDQVTMFLADTGPGSFTGVRVGIVLAKSFGWLYGKPCAGANCFDLLSTTVTSVVPSKKNEWFIRVPGEAPFRSTVLPDGPVVGFGFEGGEEYPKASGFAGLLGQLQPVSAEAFVPEYLIDPSISTPKKPYVLVPGA